MVVVTVNEGSAIDSQGEDGGNPLAGAQSVEGGSYAFGTISFGAEIDGI
jgi:hypothetical protein